MYAPKRRGFTLIELAIVLSVIGLMTVGLWRLLSSSNQQLKDTASASQQAQLIAAVKSFLATNSGSFLASNPQSGCSGGCTVGAHIVVLPLPSSTHPAGSAGCNTDGNFTNFLTTGSGNQADTWCQILPVGFSASTTNSYGQTYASGASQGIKVSFTTATAGTAPSSYSFVIVTGGGDVIADTDGGRIASQIGGEGGFIYGTAVCNSPTTHFACGSYGAWNQDITAATYGYTAPGSGGYVASQSYVAPESFTGPWLARLNLGSTAFDTLNSVNIYLNGNEICSGNGACGTDGSSINLNSTDQSSVISVTNSGGASATGSALINVNTNCTMTSPGIPATCPYAFQTLGDASVGNILQANVFFSNSDIRLKKDIHPLTDALENVMRLKPVMFRFKSTDMESLGLIAQDLNKVYPQLVSQGNENQMKSVNYQGLIAPLIGAVQELKRENDDLRARLDAEEVREQKLERQLNAK